MTAAKAQRFAGQVLGGPVRQRGDAGAVGVSEPALPDTAASRGGGTAGAIIAGAPGRRLEVIVALRAVVLMIRSQMRPASLVTDEHVPADAVAAESNLCPGEHSAFAGRQ